MSNSNDNRNGMTFWDFVSQGSKFKILLVIALVVGGLFIALLLLGFRFQYRGQDLFAFGRADSPRFGTPYRVSSSETFIAPCDGFIYASCPNPPSGARLDMVSDKDPELYLVMTTGDIGSNQSSLFPVRRGQKVQPVTTRMQGDVHIIFFPFR